MLGIHTPPEKNELFDAVMALETIRQDIQDNAAAANALCQIPREIIANDSATDEDHNRAKFDIATVRHELRETHRLMLAPRFAYIIRSLWGRGNIAGTDVTDELREAITKAYPEHSSGDHDEITSKRRAFAGLVLGSALSGGTARVDGTYADTRPYTGYKFFVTGELPSAIKPIIPEKDPPLQVVKGERDKIDPSKIWVNITDPRAALVENSAERITGKRSLPIAGCAWDDAGKLEHVIWADELQTTVLRADDTKQNPVVEEVFELDGVEYTVKRLYRSNINGELVPRELVVARSTITDETTGQAVTYLQLASPTSVHGIYVGPKSDTYRVKDDTVVTFIPSGRLSIEEALPQPIRTEAEQPNESTVMTDEEKDIILIAEIAAGPQGSIFDTFRPITDEKGRTIIRPDLTVGKTN
ncbi:hypothetical protein IPL85_06175 [Candidatus Saccharibacteria bacterium]|nr:MAG: hypothetical protein IPL85_06175 [Candidatus Saccharibacteria bacterium]